MRTKLVRKARRATSWKALRALVRNLDFALSVRRNQKVSTAEWKMGCKESEMGSERPHLWRQ